MQTDLFTSTSLDNVESNSSAFSIKGENTQKDKKTVYGMDKLLIGVCLLVVSYVVVFSWGVERGRKQTKVDTDAKIEKLHNELSRLTLVAHELARTPVRKPEIAPIAPVSGMEHVELSNQVIEPSENFETTATVSLPSENVSVPPPSAETVTFGKKQFTVQLATYVTTDRAEEQVQKLKKIGYDAFVIPSGKYFQVCVEKLATKTMAQSLKSKIQSESHLYPDAYIRNVSL